MSDVATRWSIGRLAPLVMLLALACDLASRFLPYDPFCFREWEAMTRFRVMELGGPFEPSRRYTNPRTYGGIASMGNLPRYRQYHPIDFSSDGAGFRTTLGPPGPARLVLVGSSFSGGATLSDDETLATRLAVVSRLGVYNAAGADLSDERQLRRLLPRLSAQAVVVHEYVDGSGPLDPRSFRDTERARVRAGVRKTLGSSYDRLLLAHSRVAGWLSDSPLRLWLFRGFKHVEDDRVLPNSFAPAVIQERLPNGDPILFLQEQARLQKHHDVKRAVAYWKGMERRLSAHGLQQLVVLVPNQYAVYAGFTRAGARPDIDDYTSSLERGLREAGVPVLNLTELLRSEAERGLPAKRYVYWRDDTHWNPLGADLAAREISKALSNLPESAAVQR